MNKILKISIIGSALILLGNCINIGPYNGFGPPGAVFSQYKVGVSGSDNIRASKTGKACVQKILFLATIGNGSIEEAATSAGIKRIASVDKEGFGILGPYIFQRLCTIVRGD